MLFSFLVFETIKSYDVGNVGYFTKFRTTFLHLESDFTEIWTSTSINVNKISSVKLMNNFVIVQFHANFA